MPAGQAGRRGVAQRKTNMNNCCLCGSLSHIWQVAGGYRCWKVDHTRYRMVSQDGATTVVMSRPLADTGPTRGRNTAVTHMHEFLV